MDGRILKRQKGQKGLYIATFGCQMNEYDSKRMEELLYPQYVRVDTPKDADLILINTCSIREKAEHKVYSLAGRFRKLKEKRPELIIGIGGCVAQQEGERLLKRLPYLDIVFGSHGIYRLSDTLNRIERGEGPFVLTDMGDEFKMPPIATPLPVPHPVKAFVTIMQGCDNFCTYCVVPYVRGREVSRPKEEIIEEVKRLVEAGAKDITLIGQNVNSYGIKGSSSRGSGAKSAFNTTFPELLREVAGIKGIKRLRFTTSHPKDFTDEIIEVMAEGLPHCNHLHLPVQSGSNHILKLMNRRYTRERYLKIIEEVKRRIPDVSITTDIIVGFPQETENDFNDTISLLKNVQYDQIFAFKYSPRPFTKALQFDGQIDEEVKSARLSTLLEVQREIGLKRFKRFEGRVVEVLVESQNPAREGELIARTTNNLVVNITASNDLIGRLINVFIEEASYHSMRGRALTP